MVAVTSNLAPPAAVDTPHTAVGTPRPARRIGLVPTASMITGAAVAAVWLWIPLTILVVGISSIPSVVGFAIAVVVFVYLMRGVQWLERIRSEAVFSMGIDVAATAIAFGLLVFAFIGPAAAIAIRQSDDDAGLSFLPPPLAFVLALIALLASAAILVVAPALDAAIDRWLLSPSPTAALKYQVNALSDARKGAVSSAQTERHRIERDLHDSVQPRLVSLAMTIGLAQTKLDSDLPEAKKLIGEAHEDAKSALVELRNVVRGIAPTILADRGLDAALSAVVQRSAVPTT